MCLHHPAQYQLQLQTHLEGISIKCKHTNAFSHVIEATNKNNKQIIEVMDQINLTSKFKSITL